jgi:hypothetical protein
MTILAPTETALLLAVRALLAASKDGSSAPYHLAKSTPCSKWPMRFC